MAFPLVAGKQLMVRLNNLYEQRMKKARRSELPFTVDHDARYPCYLRGVTGT